MPQHIAAMFLATCLGGADCQNAELAPKAVADCAGIFSDTDWTTDGEAVHSSI